MNQDLLVAIEIMLRSSIVIRRTNPLRPASFAGRAACPHGLLQYGYVFVPSVYLGRAWQYSQLVFTAGDLKVLALAQLLEQKSCNLRVLGSKYLVFVRQLMQRTALVAIIIRGVRVYQDTSIHNISD